METLKLFKFYSPSSMHKLFEFLPRNKSLLLKVPLVKLETTKQNFVFKATKIWNEFKDKVFDNCTPENSGIIIPGSASNSDLACSIGAMKFRLKDHLLSTQKLGNATLW